jgi:phosphate acetyltransferase
MNAKDFMSKFYQRAKNNPRTIILPESEDERVLKAAEILIAEGYCKVALIGERDEILSKGYKLDSASFYSTKDEDLIKDLTEEYYNLRKHKGISWAEAKRALEKPITLATMLLQLGKADGLVSGANAPTADVLRAAFQIVKPVRGVKTVSSFFMMVIPREELGKDGVMFVGDCAVIPDPTSEELADIALMTAENYDRFMEDDEPRVALLSFSTKGSAKHEKVDKVTKALEIAKEKNTKGYQIDGELQADAAMVPSVGEKKAPGSKVAGKANVLIFPDLGAGNIGYKLIQRTSGAAAIGPFLQGLRKPMNDLSRGCSVEDIVNTSVVTAVQASE